MSTRPALPSLVTSSQLHEALRHRPEEVRVLDATTFLHTTVEGAPYMASAGRDGYLAEHVPGAVFADVAGALSDPEAEQLFTVPSAEAFAQAAHDLGVGPTTHVVVYDTVGSAWATRVWWLFRLFGHDAVSVLDGGLGAWKAEGLPVASGTADVDGLADVSTPAFVAELRPHLLATKAEVVGTLPGATSDQGAGSSRGTVVVNALDPATFAGSPELSPYARRGRIPGSVNLPLYTLLDPSTGRFLPVEDLFGLLQAQGVLDADRAVTYCGGGIAATLPAFAAYLVAGAEVAVYDGSLSEWTADQSLPVEVG